MKWNFYFFCAALLILCPSCKKEGPSDSFTLKFGHIANEKNTWHLAAVKFKELVEERSKGKITVKIYPNSSLGTENELIDKLQSGSADLTITGESLQTMGAPKAALMALPYAFKSSEEMRVAASGEVGQQIMDEIEKEIKIVPIAWFERGPRHLTSKRPIKTPADLNGLKLRVPGVPVFSDVWNSLGAKPIPMDFSEVFTSLQSNAIEAQENPLSLIDSASFHEVQDYVNLTAHVRSWIYVVIGEKKLKSMPEDLQKIVKECAVEMQKYENELFRKEEELLRKKLQGKGMEFIESDQSAFAEKAEAAVMKSLTEDQRKLLEQLKTKD